MSGFVIILAAIILDQITKYLAISLRQGDIPLLGEFLKLSYVENRGAAFGIFQNKKFFLNFLTIGITLYLCYFLLKHYHEMNRWTIYGFFLVIGGAVGNLLDRLFRGYVIDFISVTFPGGYAFPVFNIADICVVVGTGLLIISVLFLKEKVIQ